MRFTQQIIATFALFSICAYANPMGNQLKVSSQLMTREQPPYSESDYCGGLSANECQAYCKAEYGQYRQYKCRSQYVNFEY